MRNTLKTFLIGAGCGVMVMYGFQIAKAIQSEKQTDRVFREWVPWVVTNYYSSQRVVPIPTDIDWNEDTWRKLVFWKAFARTYTLLNTNTNYPIRPKGVQTPGFRKDDPLFVETYDAFLGEQFAEDVFLNRSTGMSEHELRKWVSTNYVYDMDREDLWLKSVKPKE